MPYSLITPGVYNAAASATTVTSPNLSSGSLTNPSLIWVVGGCAASTTTLNTPTDTKGNTYTLIGSHADSAGIQKLYHWYAYNTSTGANAVTVTSSASDTVCVYALEITGLATSGAFLGHSENGLVGSSGANDVTSGTYNLSSLGGAPAALVIGAATDSGGQLGAAGTSPNTFAYADTLYNTPGTGTILISASLGWDNILGNSVSYHAMGVEHLRVTSAPGNIACTWGDVNSNRHAAVMAIFAEASAGGPIIAWVV